LKNLESVFGPIRNDSALVRIEENIEDIFAEVCEYLYTGDYSVGVSKSVGDAGEDGTDHDYCIDHFFTHTHTHTHTQFINAQRLSRKGNYH
jgi:hypothetical protein